MSLSLNSLNSTPQDYNIVGSFISKIKSRTNTDVKHNSLISNTNIGSKYIHKINTNNVSNLTHTISSAKSLIHQPDIGTRIARGINCMVNSGITVNDLKNDALTTFSGLKAAGTNLLHNTVNEVNSAISEGKELYKKVADLTNIDISSKDVEKFAEGVAVAAVTTGTIMLMNKINKLAGSRANCNGVPQQTNNSPSAAVLNKINNLSKKDMLSVISALNNAAMFEQIKNIDCAGGDAVGALGNMINNSCNTSGLTKAGTSKIMKLASNHIDVTPDSVKEIKNNLTFKSLVNKTFNHKHTINKVIKSTNGDNDSKLVGSDIVDTFGSSSLEHLKNITKHVNAKKMSKTQKKRNKYAWIGGIVKAAEVAM